MSDADYNNRVESLQRFIPFLENMIEQLKDPKMKNREQQLKKMESLYGMITDKKKKLKVETLVKCEEVIVKLYQKVKGDRANLPPSPNRNKEEKRKSVDIYSMAGESLNRRNSFNEIDIQSPGKSSIPKSFFLRKPPISYADLEVLEKDVASELERKMSLQELNSLRNELCQQLEENDTGQINTTVRNKPMLTKLNLATPERNRKSFEKSGPSAQNVTSDKKEPAQTTSKKPEDWKNQKIVTPKILKESGDIFGNAFSEIDKTYEIEAKKREERRSTGKDKRDKEEIIAEKIAHVRQLAEKAAELRNKTLKSNELEGHCSGKESDQSKDAPASVLSGKPGPTDEVTETKSNIISEEDISELAYRVNVIKETLYKNEAPAKDNPANEESIEKSKSSNDNKEDRNSKKRSDHKKDRSDRKIEGKKDHRNDHKKDEKRKEKRHEKDRKDRDKRMDTDKDSEKLKKDIQKSKTEDEDVVIISKPDQITKTDTEGNKPKNESPKTDVETNRNETEIDEKSKEINKEMKPVNRDPRLKYGATAVANNVAPAPNRENPNRLAYKYNPKPKKSDAEVDLEKNVADSIEKSMKESNVPLPPKARLMAPPPPPDDLFSPQSPDEIDKAPVPAILNDILLNPNTTGVINEVVSALKRSNNETKLLPLVSPGNILNHDINSLGLAADPNAVIFENQPLFNQFNQTSNELFSSPLQTFSAATADSQVFLQPKPVPTPLMNNAQPRGFNPFTTTMDKGNICDEMPVLDFQPALNVSNFERPTNPPHLTPYEDRMGQQGFHLDRGLNFVPPSPSYVPPSPSYVPPSPSYIPPSPVYDGGNDNFRDLHTSNFHNFSGDRPTHPQAFYDKDRIRSQGLLGDYPQMPYNSQYGLQNYDMFYNNQGGFVEPRKPFYGGTTRDPRINMKRGIQFPGNDARMMGRDSRMTYREYKEQKDRENREKELREKEMRDKEMREKELIERQRREKEETETKEKEEKERMARLKEGKEKNNKEKVEDGKDRNRDRDRDRSRDRYSRNRSSSRYRREQDNRRDRSKDKVRMGESKFDKVYSSRDIDKEDFTSPLDSLYTSAKSKTGKGYGIQFKIPKKVKEEEKYKKDEVKIEKNKEKLCEANEQEEKNFKSETCDEKIADETKIEVNAETGVSEKIEPLVKVEDTAKMVIDGHDDINKEESHVESAIEDVVEIKKEVSVVEIVDHSVDVIKKADMSSAESGEIPTGRIDDNNGQETSSGKKNEEESILSKFFQNLMKSSNKDEKKGALLSLISTFSDSFSDQQLERITNIIRCEDNAEGEENKCKTEPSKSQEIDKIEEIHEDALPKESDVEIKENQDINTNDEKGPENNDSVQVSVGERIKNRKRTEGTKPETKAKIRSKTELDRLHEDIREMFIRDGVVTATGKRMCRILKDNTVISEPEKTLEQNEEEQKKKPLTGKKRGRKVGYKKKPAIDVEMRELSVILPKMSFDKMKEPGENSDKRYSLRKPAKTTNYNEIDLEENKNKDSNKLDEPSEVEESKEDLEEGEESKDWTDLDNSVEEPKKFRSKRKVKKSWATGVIKKKNSGKTKKTKSPTRIEDSDAANQKDQDSAKKLPDKGQPLHLHDKDYYFKADITSLPCKVCDVSTKWIAAHYRSEHPDIEVLSSRLPPNVAQIAIDDAIANKEAYEEDNEVSNVKHEYSCRFCDYSQTTLPRMYRDHVSIHTGEFRHRCPYCSYRRSHIKSMQTHVNEVHAAEETKSRRRIISQMAVTNRNIYAYLCEVCNYTQMSLQHVQDHIKIYHSGTKKCKIHKIKMNYLKKEPKEKSVSEVVQEQIKTSPNKERPATRSAKLSQTKNNDAEEDKAPEMDLEEAPSLADKSEEEYEEPNVDETPPQLTKEVEVPKMSASLFKEEMEETTEATEDSESQSTSIDEPIKRKTRKRKKSFAKPGPARKRGRKKIVRPVLSSTDTENESDVTRSSPRKRNDRNVSENKSAKKIDEAVFTCNTDLLEENKQIEEERMRKMQDLNSTIKLRTSLEFVERLSNRLKQEDEVMVKQESSDQDEEGAPCTFPPNELPVYEKSALQKREVEQTPPVRHDGSPEGAKDGGKANTIINGVIEKLRGVLNNTTPSSGELAPPPLKHIDRVEKKTDRDSNSQVLNIGPIKVLKSGDTSIYTCCSPPCIFSSRDQKIFEKHCRGDHHWRENAEKFPNCLECDSKIEFTEDNPLLVSALEHALKFHSAFLGVRIGSIRVSSNLFPEGKTDEREIREASSDDATLTPPTICIPSPPGAGTADESDALFSTEVLPGNFEDENPFSFKIVDVVSLAEDEVPPLSLIDNQMRSGKADEFVASTANAIPISPKKTNKTLVVSPAVKSPEKLVINPLMQLSNNPKKSPNALKKFVNAHNDLFKCPEFACLFTTNKRKMFDIHIRMHPNQNVKSLCCLYCDKFVVLESMGDHYEQFHGLCRFACFYCLYRCIAKDYMDLHQLLVHPELPPRMQFLSKRDSEDKNLISILSDSAKITHVPPYTCCGEDFVYYLHFVAHLEKCAQNPRYVCQFRNAGTDVCGKGHATIDELMDHWGMGHGVYPLKCGYCDVGSFDLPEMMIHLVLVHPTLPPDVIDRSVLPKNKNQTCPSRAQCNFKQLVTDLRSDPSKFKMYSASDSSPQTSTPTTLSVVPQSMQKAFENFVQQSNIQSGLAKAVTTYSKVTPVNILPATTTGMSMFKATPNPNMLTSGGVVYCLAPTTTAQKQLMKAIVVNKDNPTGVSQKVRLLSPVTMPTSDAKFQMIKTMHKMIPIASKMPRLAPLGAAQRVVHAAAVAQQIASDSQPEALPSTEEGGRTDAETNDALVEVADPLALVEMDGDTEPENSATDGAELPNFEEPMMVIDEEFEDKNRDEAVDPLSLETEDPLTAPKAPDPYPGATPLHDYDSDFKDIDPQDAAGVRKTGLMGYQLYRCAKCDLSFPDHSNFKDHLIKSVDCKFFLPLNRPYKCAHCGRFLKHYTNLLHHLDYHGRERFSCSLCNKKYPQGNQVKQHMKTQHNVGRVVVKPLSQIKGNLCVDEFVMKPAAVRNVKTSIKEAVGEGEAHKSGEAKTIFYSHEADDIPQKSILSYDITCGHCKKFKNKVRSNIVRHLLLHKNDKDFTVPDTAPINPVPCLEKNEKMFDKMFNLASSSHAGGRMGGQQKGDAKKTDKVTVEDYPAFVPANKRFQCCAVGCNYLCLEEGNLRHHITALHMEVLNFVCVHCKSDLSDAADVDTILKHLKLHELHLYKCGACKFMHNLRHKIERHIGEKHKNKECAVVVLRAMDSEPYDENQQTLAPFPVVMNQKSMKQWRCCMCKYRCYTQEEAEVHAKNKHDVDRRYKCALCAFKSNVVSEFTGHFETEHPDNNIDIILAYHKEDEQNEAVSEPDQFDTTPLWLRDKPRVRHIRGILFEENNLPAKKKSGAAKTPTAAEQSYNGPSSAKKRKRSVSAVAEPFRYPENEAGEEEEEAEPKKEVEGAENTPLDNDEDDIIVIDDEEDEEEELAAANQPVPGPPAKKAHEERALDDIDLLCTYGDVGMPVNKNFKCPKCDKYRTTRMRDFVQHVAKEMHYHRFRCSICDENFVTLESIKMHCIDFHDCSIKSIVPLAADVSLGRWLTILLEKQRTIIRNLGFQTEDMPNDVDDFLGNHESGGAKSAIQKENFQKPLQCNECGFWVSGVLAMNRHLKYNHPHIDFDQSGSLSPKPSTSVQPPTKRTSDGQSENLPESKKPRMQLKNTLIAKDKYVCSLCGKDFDSVPEMEFHGKDRHDGEITYVVQTTELPMTYEYGRNIYRCRYCATTGTKPSLEIHSSQVHPNQKPNLYRFSCGVCPAKFEVLKNFKQHFKSHELATVFYFDVHDNKVTLKSRTVNNAKIKLYKCPVCPYISHSVNSTNIKTHLKIHARPFQCDLCRAQFKSRPDARSHHLKEHPHNVEMISERVDMVQKISALMEEVMRHVQSGAAVQPTESATVEEEEEVLIEVVPDVVLDAIDEDPAEREDAPAAKTRHFARKSTGKPAKPYGTDEYYSFYGRKPEPVDMRKIVTTFEIADAKMRMTCDQLSRIYNLKPRLVLKDCMTLIIEDDDLSS